MSFLQSWTLSKLPTGPATTIANGQPENGITDEEPKGTPYITPEIARRHPTRIPQITSTPKKGILKHTSRAKSTEPFPVFSANRDPAVGSIRATVSYTLADSFFKMPPTGGGPRPTVGFSEKNAVAIIGDTSDEYESDGRKSFSLPVPSEQLPQIPETTIVEPPSSMIGEPEEPGVINGVFLRADESDSATERSQDESKITEGRSTDDIFSTTEDDLVSISSSTCSSHIAGKWWNGKDQRFVVHCEKKGCKHRHGSPKIGDGYLTPTQRHSRELAALNNEIKRLNEENSLKEQQLVELRERIKQIDDGHELAQDNKLMKLLEEKSKKYEEDKERLKSEGQQATNHLKQQIFELQSQLASKQAKVEKFEMELFKPQHDASTMTDPIESMDELGFPPGFDGQTTVSSGSVAHTPSDPNPTAANFLSVNQKSVSVQQSPSFPSVPAQLVGGVGTGVDAMTEAYRQEALFFRTKASELELIIREHILKNELVINDTVQTSGPVETEPSIEVETPVVQEDGEQRKLKRTLTHSMSLMFDTGSNYSIPTLNAIKRQQSVVTGECQSQVCAEKIKKLVEENDSILEKMDDQFVRFSEIEEELAKTKDTLETEHKENIDLKESYEELSHLANERLAELLSAQRAYQKEQEETEKLEKAVNYLEDRCQAYQNTILDNGLVVRGEETKEWRRGFDDPRFQVFHSKQAQTELTGQELSATESEYTLLHIQLREIQKEYGERQLDLDAQFAEIEQNLTLKTRLVEQLTKQMEISAHDSQLIEEHRQKERDYYKDRIEQLSNELERLPGLQMEIERVQQEKSLMQIELKTIKERYEDGLDEALNQALKKYREQEEYWSDKVQILERSRGDVKNLLDKLQINFEELSMRAQLEKAELEQRLASSIEHVAVLNQQLNPLRRDVACEAKPKTTNKYVACRPNHRHKLIEVNRKELEPSESDRNIAELVKYKEALLRARKRLSDLNPSKALPKPQLTFKIPVNEEDEEKRQDFKSGLKKSKVSRSQVISGKTSLSKRGRSSRELSFDQVYFDRKTGVTLPSLRKHAEHRSSDEEEEDATSFMSLPAVIQDYQRSIDEADFHPQTDPLEEESDDDTLKTSVSKSIVIETAGEESSTQMLDTSMNLEVAGDDGSIKTEAYSIEDIKNLDENTGLLEHEVRRLRDKVTKAQQLEGKLEKIRCLLPPLIHIGAPPTEKRIRKPIDVLMEDVISVLKDARIAEPFVRRSNSLSNLGNSNKFPYLIKPCVQLNAKLQKKPLFKPLPIPTKWDNERAELLKQNARYAAQLLALKAKLGLIRQDSKDKTELDKIEDELRALAQQMTTIPDIHAKKLARTRKDRDELFLENLDLQMKLQDALNELEIYRQEPREKAEERLQSAYLPKSRSAESLNHATSPDDLRRWKEAAGVSFRELNRLRRLCDKMEEERREMNARVAIMKGETELTKCQMAIASEWAVRKLEAMRTKGSQKGAVVSKERQAQRRTSLTTNGSVPDLTKINQLPSTTSNQRHKASHPESLDQKSTNDFFEDSPFQKELQRAFQKQLTTLKEKNKELEGRVEDLEEKIAINNKELVKAEEHKGVVEGLHGRIEILKQENEMYEQKIREIEEERQDMYILMFKKGQQAAHHDLDEDKRIDEMTEDRLLLKFLHDAFFYYLTNKGDSREHLQAIMTMLNFTSKQKDDIYKKRGKSQ